MKNLLTTALVLLATSAYAQKPQLSPLQAPLSQPQLQAPQKFVEPPQSELRLSLPQPTYAPAPVLSTVAVPVTRLQTSVVPVTTLRTIQVPETTLQTVQTPVTTFEQQSVLLNAQPVAAVNSVAIGGKGCFLKGLRARGSSRSSTRTVTVVRAGI